MKTIAVLLMLSILAGACAAEQNWLDPNMVGFNIDPNMIDNNLITAVRIEADPNAEYSFEQGVEPHIWPITITYDGIPPGSRTDGPLFYWQPTTEQVGTWYFKVTAKDDPPFYINSISITGVWAVRVVPKNPGPILVPFVR